MDIYLFLFLIILLMGSISVAFFYFKEKREALAQLERGFCPQCHEKSIEISDRRSGGCGAPELILYRCLSCLYEESFSVTPHSSCGGGRCR